MSVGTGFYAVNAFMEPLCALRGWTRTDINLALVIGTFFGFAGQFVYGTLVTRIGVRSLMLGGSLIAGTAFFFIGRATSLWQFYIAYSLVFIGNGAYGGIVASTAVNNWFVAKRGRALGIATAGVSFSGAVVPPAALLLIINASVETAALALGLMVILVAPFAWGLVRDWPEGMGMLPDGSSPLLPPEQSPDKPPGAELTQSNLSDDWPLKALLRSGTFWKLGTAYALLMIGTVGVMSQLKPRFADIGFADTTAMAMMAATALVGTVGKYIWGRFCDRYDPSRVASLLALSNAIGLALSLIHNSPAALVLFIIVFGFTMGGIMSTYPIIVAHLFSRESFPRVLRFVSIFLILQLAGYIIAGRSYDRLGSYDPAYVTFIVFDLLAACLFYWLPSSQSTERRDSHQL